MKENKEIIIEGENKTIFEEYSNNETDSNINDITSSIEKIKEVKMEIKEYLDSEENKNKEYKKNNEIISFLKIREKKEFNKALIKIDIDYLVFEEEIIEKEKKKNNILEELKLSSNEINIHKKKEENHSFKEEIKKLKID